MNRGGGEGAGLTYSYKLADLRTRLAPPPSVISAENTSVHVRGNDRRAVSIQRDKVYLRQI